MTEYYGNIAIDDLIDLPVDRAPFTSRPDHSRKRTPPVLAVRIGANEDTRVVPSSSLRHDSDAADLLGDPRRYRPLDSVWHGEEDAVLVEELLRFYPHRDPRLILDATVNGRRCWRGSNRPVIGLDIDPSHGPDICADNAATPFRSAIFDVVVYDLRIFRIREAIGPRISIHALGSGRARQRSTDTLSLILIRHSWPKPGEY